MRSARQRGHLRIHETRSLMHDWSCKWPFGTLEGRSNCLVYISTYIYIYNDIWYMIYIYIWVADKITYRLPAMDMAKVGGPLSVVKVWGPHYRWLRISASTVWFPAQSTCLYWEHITRTLALMSLFPSLLMNNMVNCALTICLTVHLPRYHCNEKELLNMSHVMLQQLGFFKERTRFPRYNPW